MRVVTAAAMAAIDRETIEGGVPGLELMERAGRELGMTSRLIACFLRDRSEADAEVVLTQVLHRLDVIHGVGLEHRRDMAVEMDRTVLLPGAIALAHANPEWPVVSVSGDGGFAMMVQELETVNRLGISPLFVVFVDQALSLIRIPQQMRGIPSRGVDFAPVDWAMVAEGFGVRGVWTRTENELHAAVTEWVDNRQAMVIAVQVDEALYCGNSY